MGGAETGGRGGAYRVNEIFRSIQGEGYFTGTAAVFIRFAGCNLRCSFCDTDYSRAAEMSLKDIMQAVRGSGMRHVVLTGGEPSLQADEALTGALRAEGLFVQMETNGTRPLPKGIGWVTLSPKTARLALDACDELKVVYRGQPLGRYDGIRAAHRFLQPCCCGDASRDREMTLKTAKACMNDSRWRLSLQTHKYIGIK